MLLNLLLKLLFLCLFLLPASQLRERGMRESALYFVNGNENIKTYIREVHLNGFKWFVIVSNEGCLCCC
jgi:hypothetical protein